MDNTPQGIFNRWVENQRASYRNDTAKLTAFNSAINFLYGNSVSLDSWTLSTGTASRTIGRIHYAISYQLPQSLTILNLDTRETRSGYVRQLLELRDGLTQPVNSDPLFCAVCRKAHKKYGLELEMNLLSTSSGGRYMLQQFLNGKMDVDTARDDFGTDGGGPFEIRNINGNTPEEVTGVLRERIIKIKEKLGILKGHFPRLSDTFTLNRCGIHVHHFHKGYSREKVATAHALVALLVNWKSKENWFYRLPTYGNPYDARSMTQLRVDWCNDQNQTATEHRTLNVVHPDVLRWAMEKTESILTRNFDCTSRMFHTYRDRQNIILDRTRMNADSMDRLLGFFTGKNVVTVTELANMRGELDTLWKPFSLDLAPATPRATSIPSPAPVASPVPTELPPVNNGTSATEAAIMDGLVVCDSSSWCDRFQTATDNPNQWVQVGATYFRNSMRRHLETCNVCANNTAHFQNGGGYRFRTRPHAFGLFNTPVRRRGVIINFARTAGLGPDGYGR